jgi:hypothetical protein
MLSPDDELEIACLIGCGESYQYLTLLKKLFPAYRELKAKYEDLQEWNKILTKQLERYKRNEN